MTEQEPPTEPDAGHRAGPVVAAVALTGVLGAALLAYGVFLVAEWFVERPDEPVNAALLVVLSLGWGAGLLGCARGLRRGRRWAMAPVVTSALLLLAVGWLLASGHGTEVVFGWALLVLAGGCLVCVLAAGSHLH